MSLILPRKYQKTETFEMQDCIPNVSLSKYSHTRVYAQEAENSRTVFLEQCTGTDVYRYLYASQAVTSPLKNPPPPFWIFP